MLCNKQTKRKLTFVLTAVVLAVLSWPITSTAQIPGDPNLLEEPQMPGTIEGTGTYFEVTDSDYLNVTFESTESVHLFLESVPQMVVMDINAVVEGTTSTQITLGGFEPSTTYYKYEDDYHNEVAFTTDDDGSYSYTQDLSEPHLIFIQPQPGTIFIPTDTSVGTWDPTNRIYTLTKDVSESIQVDENYLTLDGAGHTVGPYGGIGVYLNQRTGVTVKNLNVQGMSYGIYLSSGSGNTIKDNTASNNRYGIYLAQSSNNILERNTASNNSYYGITAISGSSNNKLRSNTANSNGYGILVGRSGSSCSHNILTGNTANSNNIHGITIGKGAQDSYHNVLTGNTARYNGSAGINLFYNAFNSTLTSNIAMDNLYGIRVDSDRNPITLRRNTMSGNQYNFWFSVAGIISNPEKIDIDTSNTVNGKPIWFVVGASDTVYDSSTNAGIFYAVECENITISDLTLSNNYCGVYLHDTDNSRIENVTASNNYMGIKLRSSQSNTLTGNACLNGGYGILLDNIYECILRDNTMSGNKFNFWETGWGSGMMDIDTSNLVDGKPIWFVVGASDTVYDSSTNAGTFYAIDCQNITIRDLTCTNNGNGVCLRNTHDSTIENIVATNNKWGIHLALSTYNVLAGNMASSTDRDCESIIYLRASSHNNTISGNTVNSSVLWKGIELRESNGNIVTDTAVTSCSPGIRMYKASYSTVTDNIFESGGTAVYIVSSSDNVLARNLIKKNWSGIQLTGAVNNQIYNNDFIYNGLQATSSGSGNVFNLPAPTGGNFWSNWMTPDEDGDGFVDYPYVFSGGQDNLPLTQPVVGCLTPQEMLGELINQVVGLNLQKGIENSLDAKLDAALKALEDINSNNDVAAINTLDAFINAVEAQSGNKISEANANALIATVQAIFAVLENPDVTCF
ncbi:nitrous oxide reductase family maturation protein NosD [Planctomycetota bacterium]